MQDLLFLLADAASPSTSAPAGPSEVATSTSALRTFVISLAYLVSAACFIFGLKMLASPRSARRGNLTASLGMLLAVLATVADGRILGGRPLGMGTILAGLVVGATVGATFALRVNMRGMPQMVALLNGFGGLAAALVGFGEYLHESEPAADVRFSVALSILIGMITFTGSVIAFGKLEELKYKIAGQPLSGPVLLPFQGLINAGGAVLIVVLVITLCMATKSTLAAIGLLALAAVFGVIIVLPIGGADMPVIIAMLNSFSGLGAAATGFVLHNNALIIGGSLVGASGFILTTIMCKAMNRSLLNVVAGGFGAAPAAAAGGGKSAEGKSVRRMDAEEAAMVLEAAQSVIIVPGYGMAVAQAQHAVAELGTLLTKKGINVKYAVHPVAGRMPGHMNVLLAEANVPYELLHDLEINGEFERCDAVLVIGANDVVNPAARHDKTSPIFGMPIFDADKARTVMVSKRSLNPGFAGIENELFYLPNTVMLFGDAKQMITGIVNQLKGH